MGIMQFSSNIAVSCGHKMQFNRKVTLISLKCAGWNVHLSKRFCTVYLLGLQVVIKYSAVRGFPSKLMKVNPTTAPRQFNADDELKSSSGRTGVQANLAYNSLQNTLSMFGQLETKSSVPVVPIWEEVTQIWLPATTCSCMPGYA